MNMKPALAIAAFASAPAFAGTAIISGHARIIDGDTFDLGAVRIRLHGIDAPEAGQTCNPGGWACGMEATNRLAGLVAGQKLDCEATNKDRYGRLIARCSADGTDIAQALIEDGLAWAYTKYSQDYVRAEAEAQTALKGVWKSANQTAWDFRANGWARAASASPHADCPIKGNVASDGERIYHTPWSPAYNRTRIDEAKGERWFCDEGEALSAGWRAARWR